MLEFAVIRLSVYVRFRPIAHITAVEHLELRVKFFPAFTPELLGHKGTVLPESLLEGIQPVLLAPAAAFSMSGQ